jgi:UDPglucose--hexose-1-phosphate uridylyltransferase
VQELLVDELTGDRVILAPGRAFRPDAFRVERAPRPEHDEGCPFCDGNEADTPPEVARVGPGRPDTPGWHVRVVPNKYPIVGEGVPGAHEVVILSPAHHADLGVLSVEACTEMLLALRDRARFHLDRGLTYAQPFVNHGRAAGASIQHPHAQLVALDFVPPKVEARVKGFTVDAFSRNQENLVDDGDVKVWCPRASISPFFARAAIDNGGPRFDEASDDETGAVAAALHDTVSRMHNLLGDVDYNLVFETAPRDHTGPFHWWVDVIPRLTVLAGFEFGTGMWVNIVPPAQAAESLREGASMT